MSHSEAQTDQLHFLQISQLWYLTRTVVLKIQLQTHIFVSAQLNSEYLKQGWIKFRGPENLKDFEGPLYRVIASTECIPIF